MERYYLVIHSDAKAVVTHQHHGCWWYQLNWTRSDASFMDGSASAYFGPHESEEKALEASGYLPWMERPVASTECDERLTLHQVGPGGVSSTLLCYDRQWHRIVRAGLPGCDEVYELQTFARDSRDEYGDPMISSEPLRSCDCLEFPDGSMLRLDELPAL